MTKSGTPRDRRSASEVRVTGQPHNDQRTGRVTTNRGAGRLLRSVIKGIDARTLARDED